MSREITRPQKPDYQELMDVVERRNIPFFLHYTPVKNLTSIFQYGILSRKQMKLRDIKPVLYHGWGKKWRELDDYICLSIIPPKGMIDRTREPQVALAVNPSIIGCKDTYFSPINSAKDNIDTDEIFTRDSVDAFEGLFKYPDNNKLRNDMAEILVKDYIPCDLIELILVPGWRNYSKIFFSLKIKNLLNQSPPVHIDPDLF